MRTACRPRTESSSLLPLEFVNLQTQPTEGGFQLMPCLSTLTPVRLETIPQSVPLMQGIPVKGEMRGKLGRKEETAHWGLAIDLTASREHV